MKSIKIHDDTHQILKKIKKDNQTIDDLIRELIINNSEEDKLDYIDDNVEIIINMLNGLLNSADETWNKNNLFNTKRHPFFFGAVELLKSNKHKNKINKRNNVS